MPKVYYQVLHVASPNVTADKYEMVYENDDCVVSYNFWKDGGQPGFEIYNKTNENIYIDLYETHFIKNGTAYNYFKHRTYSEASQVSVGNKKTNSSYNGFTAFFRNGYGYGSNSQAETSNVKVSSRLSIDTQEERIICIPPHSSKSITEYVISSKPFRDCDYLRFPKRSQISVLRYNQENSPFILKNRITYTVGANQNVAPRVIDNDFYVSNIVNFPANEITDKITRDACGEKLTRSGKVINSKYAKPDNFYIEYNKQGSQKY